jgi:photosystem II stability/assembly factor-like uncharacterized protein
VTSPRDPIDDWLGADVTPLSPPPGSLARIRQQARRRKTRQATFAAAGCAVVLAAAVATPQVISALHQPGRHHNNQSIAIGSTTPSLQPSRGSNTPSPYATKPVQIHQRSLLSTTTSNTTPPPNFRPTSVTFVGTGHDTVVGAVIGQAGTPGHCATAYCTSLAGTSTYGSSWYGVSAPVAPGPPSAAGVSQLRFATMRDGWAFGPALYETSGGGWPWHYEDINGQSVIDLEASPARAFAVFGTCNGSGSAYAAGCTSFSLWTSVPGSRSWTQVSLPAPYSQLTSASSAAPLLVIGGGNTPTAYLLTPSGELLSAPVAGGSWKALGAAKCKPASPAASGQAAQPVAQLAVGAKLVLACDAPTTGGRFSAAIYTSGNGATWTSAGSVTVKGTPTSLASASAPSAASGVVVLATTAGIEYSADGGKSWQKAKFTGGPPTGGFSYIGMTDPNLGVAVPVHSSLGEIFTTSDGGKTWQPSPIVG